MSRIAVIGGGASGMTAALTAREAGAEVVLFEHNEKLGKKLLLQYSVKTMFFRFQNLHS